jgi:hypothetical protein
VFRKRAVGFLKGVVLLEVDLLLGQGEEIVRAVLDKPVGRDKKSASSSRRVLYYLPGCGCMSRTMQSISGRGVKYV